MDFRSARGAYVVLDATEIHRDWYLTGLEFRLLRFLAREAGIRPVVPSSVVAESVANHSREYARARKALLNAVADMRRVAGVTAVQGSDVPAENTYSELLVERLDNLGVEVIGPPETPHDEIVARAVSRRPPFDQNGSGYRDTLVWMTCVELAATGNDVYLVSQDKDFGARAELASELATEVADLPGSVSLVRHLGMWLTPLVPWSEVSDMREAAALARDEEVASLFAPWDIFEDPNFTAEELGLPKSATIHEVSYYGSGGYLERVGHEKTEDGGDRIVYEFPIEFEVFFSLDTDEAREAGLVQHESSATGVEDITTVISMRGRMTVVHDERYLESPLYFERFQFLPTLIHRAVQHDPSQLSLPLDPGMV